MLAAQAFTSLIPFVAAAFGPGASDLPDRIVDRFDLHGTLGQGHPDPRRAVLHPRASTDVPARLRHAADGLEGGLARPRLAGRVRRAWIVVSSSLRGALEDVGGIVFAIALSTALGFVLWLVTPRILLGPMDWRRLLRGATLSAVLASLLTAASGIYVPILMGGK